MEDAEVVKKGKADKPSLEEERRGSLATGMGVSSERSPMAEPIKITLRGGRGTRTMSSCSICADRHSVTM
jgi:hypothetical protein